MMSHYLIVTKMRLSMHINISYHIDYQYDASTTITNPLKDLIIQQSVTAQLPDVSCIKHRIHMDI